MDSESYEHNVFLNCPFDDQYFPFFQAAVFTIMDSGFQVRCALETSDASQVRIQKIYDLIAGCRLGIHDLSRTDLDKDSKLPRFNMPLEFGIFLGAAVLGGEKQKQKMCLVFDEEPYRYQKYISDIAGQDISSHHNDLRVLVKKIRDWLAGFSPEALPSGVFIWQRYERFRKELKAFCAHVKQHPDELTYLDYVSHVRKFVPGKTDVLSTGLENRWGKELHEPSLFHIREAIENLTDADECDSFAILAKSGGGFTYMQVFYNSVSYELEHQEGPLDEHYECIDDLTTEDVVEAFQAYRRGEMSWKTKFRWTKQKLY